MVCMACQLKKKSASSEEIGLIYKIISYITVFLNFSGLHNSYQIEIYENTV